MAHIVLATFGTLGDMFPFLRVGQYLQESGHQVTVATSTYYEQLVQKHGLGFAKCGPSEDEMVRRFNITMPELMRRCTHPWTGIEFATRHVVMPTIVRDYHELKEACLGADLLVSHIYAFAAPLVHQKLGIPWSNLLLQPIALMSSHDPSVLNDYIPFEKIGRILGPSRYASVQQKMLSTTSSWFTPLHALAKRENIPPMLGHPLGKGGWPSTPMYAMFDPILWRTNQGFPSNLVHCGYSHWDGGGYLDTETRKWIAQNPEPIVFTLGSSAVHHARHFYTAALNAMTRLNKPAILLAGEHQFDNVPKHVRVLPWAPHHQLFQQSSLIVHQGGSGTCSNALRSGRPQVIYAFGNDQPDNAQRLQDLGVAIRKTARRITVNDMANTIEACLHDRMLQVRARALTHELMPDDGAKITADYLVRDYLMAKTQATSTSLGSC